MLAAVLLLSRVLGRVVLDTDGRPLGRLADLTVRVDGGDRENAVERLLVSRRGAPDLLLPWGSTTDIQIGTVVSGAGTAGGSEVGALREDLGADEILLGRDVLDTQVVDVVGQRLARVADVLLTRTRDARLEVAGVDVGIAGVLRRLGLPVRANRADIVAWADLHLTSERGHAVQLSTPRAAVHRLAPRALAALVSRVDTEAATEILAGREPGVAAQAVRAAHPEVGERMLRAMPAALAARIVAAMGEEHAGSWRRRLARRPLLRGRRFLRSTAWPRRRQLIRHRRS